MCSLPLVRRLLTHSPRAFLCVFWPFCVLAPANPIPRPKKGIYLLDSGLETPHSWPCSVVVVILVGWPQKPGLKWSGLIPRAWEGKVINLFLCWLHGCNVEPYARPMYPRVASRVTPGCPFTPSQSIGLSPLLIGGSPLAPRAKTSPQTLGNIFPKANQQPDHWSDSDGLLLYVCLVAWI